jgi:hypothetical protein
MLAVIGTILAALAGLLKLLHNHGSWVLPLLIIGVILIGAEVAWGWNRGGRYGRTAP